MSKKIKIGILIDSYDLHAWEYSLLERLKNAYYVSIELVVVNQKKTRRRFLPSLKGHWNHIIFIYYNKLDRKLFKKEPDAFSVKEATHLLNGISSISVKSISGEFQDEEIREIKDSDLDVLVKLGVGELKGDILQAARYGTWAYHHGDIDANRGNPAGFWEVFEHWDVTGSTLQILTDPPGTGKILYRSFSSSDQRSVNRGKNSYYWKSLSFLPRKLEELYTCGAVKFFEKVKRDNQYLRFYSKKTPSSKDIGNGKMLMLIASNLLKLIEDRLVTFFYLDQWILLFDLNDGISTSFCHFTKIIPPKDRFYADPFVIQKDNKYFIFFEECPYDTKKGYLSVMEMDENGGYEKPIKILETPYHLSYPFIFEHEGDYYLIPESHANGAISLYKCIEFPLKWEFQLNLMENIKVVDTTLFFYQNRWWLFTNIAENEGASIMDELFLFSSETLHTTNWIPHPLNPIVSDVRKARLAGRIFEHDGMILRPSQNCSKRYGYGFKMNVIKTLNEHEYEEEEIASIEPDWDKTLKATHTFNHTGNLTMIDGIMRRRR